MADDFLFLTELLGLKVYDLKGRRLGLVKDAAIVPLIHPSRVDRFLVGGGWAWLTVRYDQIRSISLDGIFLKDEQLTPYHSDEYMLRLVRDLLDQQIIDGQGRKVVRVTDVTFKIQHEAEGQVINILDVDIGLRSVLRRLAQGVVPPRLDSPGAGVDPAAFHSLGPLQHYRSRSAAPIAAQHQQQNSGADASRGSGRHRGRSEPGRSRSHLRNHR